MKNHTVRIAVYPTELLQGERMDVDSFLDKTFERWGEDVITLFEDKILFTKVYNDIKAAIEIRPFVLSTILENEVSMNFEFARNLHLGDVIDATYFQSETDTGKFLLSMIQYTYTELTYQLALKEWSYSETLTLHFNGIMHMQYFPFIDKQK